MNHVFYGSIFVFAFRATAESYYPDNETGSGESAGDYYGSPDYFYEQEPKDEAEICSTNALKASSSAKVLTSSAKGEKKSDQWSIVPYHKGGVVALAMIEYTMGSNFFTQQCADIQVFENSLNSTTLRKEPETWCRESRLLPCDMALQIAFFFGYVMRSSPGNGVDIVHTPTESLFDYDGGGGEKTFRMYYYECGGHRSGGEIASPTFPSYGTSGSHVGPVSCKWELRVGRTSDYGILKFVRFNLPRCKDHYLLVEEDTVIKEEDVTDALLSMLDKSKTASKRSSADEDPPREANNDYYGSTEYDVDYGAEEPSTGEPVFEYYEVDEPKEKNSDAENKYTFFYREASDGITDNTTVRSIRSGVHAVVITKYCGRHHPPRTMYWKRGSKDITLTYVSENATSSDEGFEAEYSVFSWEHTMNEHRHPRRKPDRPPRHSMGVSILLNYIVAIVFIPIGVSIGLGIIIFHIKKRGPTLRDFYKKEKQQERQRLQRAKTERIKSVSPRHQQRIARRAQSLDLPQSPLRSREMTESVELSRPLIEYHRPIPIASRLNSRRLEGAVRQPRVTAQTRRFPTSNIQELRLPARELL